MLTKVFAVYDSKAEAFLSPMFFQTRGLALRAFTAAASDEKHNFFKFAGDYTLFEIGEFDERSGDIKMFEAKVNLGTALQLADRQPLTAVSN